MNIRLIFQCEQCLKEAVSTRKMMHFVIKSKPIKHIEDITPKGWVACDPHQFSTYCDECWPTIEKSK